MLFVRDRVKQGTTTTGAGTITLDSSFGGYQNFSVLDNGTQTFYAIEESTNWEVGIGTYSSNTLTRDTVLAGASGDGVPIYLSGSATAFITYPASGAVFTTGNIASLTGVKLGVSGVAFSDGTTQTTAGTSFSATSGARIDLNDGRISTIESTGVALTGSVSSLAGSGVGYSSRISTIESTGVALTGSVIDLATSGTSNFTGIYNTSGNLDSRLIATGNALESSSFSAFTGAKIDLNTSRVTAIMSTGVALTGSVINLASSGVGYSSRISTIESTGVATAANLISSGNILFTGLYNTSGNMVSSSTIISTGNALWTGIYNTSGNLNSRISTIETTGVATAAEVIAMFAADRARLTTIESTGVATAANLISSGNILFTGLYNTSGNMVSSSTIISTGNSLWTGVYNTSGNLNARITTIESTGVATAANLLSTGATNAAAIVADRARLTTIESTGVATAANLLSTGATNAAAIVADRARLTTIESTGVATAANLIATGAVVQDGHQNINVSIATASGIVTPLISGTANGVTNLDLALGTSFNYVLTANSTFQVKNVTKGQKFTLRTEQDSGGTNTVTWAMGSQIKWAEGGTAPTGTYYGGMTDFYGFVAVETGLFDGFVIGSNIQ